MDIERKRETKADTVGEGSQIYTKALRKIILWLVCSLLGYLSGIATLPLGAKPFGAALLSAALGAEVLPIFAGLCLSALNYNEPLLLIAIWSATLFVRLLSRLLVDTPRIKAYNGISEDSVGSVPIKINRRGTSIRAVIPYLFKENLILRMATSAMTAFAVSLLQVLKYQFLYFDVFGMIIAVLGAPLATLFFSWGFEKGRITLPYSPRTGEKILFSGSKQNIKKAVGLVAICLFVVFTLKGNSIYSISLSAFFAMGFTLFFCRTRGILFGGIAGLLFGLVYSPLLSPIFVFAAFASGVLFPLSVTLAAWTSFAIGIAWGFYVRGIAALSGLFPALLTAVLLFTVADRLFISEKTGAKEKTAVADKTRSKELPCTVPMSELALDTLRLDNTKQKIKNLCTTLSSLSGRFGEMSDRHYKSPAESCIAICDAAFDSCCTGCENKAACREGVSINKVTEQISRTLLQNRTVCISDAGEALSSVCDRLPDIIDEVNHNAAASAKNSFEYDKSEIFSLDYAAVANLLAEAQVEESEEFKIDHKLTKLLCEVINSASLEVPPSEVMVYGKTRRAVIMRGNSRSIYANKEELIDLAESVLPFALDRSRKGIYDAGEITELRVSEAPRINAVFSLRSVSADSEDEVCGDSLAAFNDDDAHFYACISDGMGSGKRAAAASGIAVDFIEKMLSSGAASYGRSSKTVIEMLNGFLRTKNFGSVNECSATVDLLELDTVNKSAFFCKCGAAPTYVFRGGSLFKLRSDSLPIGIMDKVDCRAIRFGVDVGDTLIMLSDGVVQGKEESPWLFDLLRATADTASADSIADKIVKYAKNSGSEDDISVAVIKINKA